VAGSDFVDEIHFFFVKAVYAFIQVSSMSVFYVMYVYVKNHCACENIDTLSYSSVI
jgi:hypothetical protein